MTIDETINSLREISIPYGALVNAIALLEQQQSEIKQIEMRVLENFIRCMPTTYRKYNRNWELVQDLFMCGTLTAGQTSCIAKCEDLGIEPYGYTLERVTDDENSDRI